MKKWILLAAVWVAVPGSAVLRAAPETPARPLPATPCPDLGWWRGFADPQLDELLAGALATSPDVRTAAARLGVAGAVLGGGRAGRRSWLDLDGGAGVRKYSPTAKYQDPDINRPGLELSAGYTVDLWGRLDQAEKAGVADWKAAVEDVTSARLALAAQVGSTWFALRANTDLRQILTQRLGLAREGLALRRMRVGAGLTTGDEQLAQSAFLAKLEFEQSRLKEDGDRLGHRLAALRGLSAADARPLVAPPLDGLAAPALPRDLNTGLLERRPDVRAAELRLRAEQARVGVARAATLPSLALLGRGFFAGDSLRELLRGGSLEGFIAAQVHLPLLDGGRSRAGLDTARAGLTLAGEQYSAVVVRAFAESADAVSSAESAQARLEISDRVAEACERTLALVRRRDAAGLVDRLVTLQAQDQELLARQAIAEARLDFLRAQVDLGLALALGAPPAG